MMVLSSKSGYAARNFQKEPKIRFAGRPTLAIDMLDAVANGHADDSARMPTPTCLNLTLRRNAEHANGHARPRLEAFTCRRDDDYYHAEAGRHMLHERTTA